MKKYAKIINNDTKACIVGLGTDENFYQSMDMTLMDVEQSYDGSWYLSGHAPTAPTPTYSEQRRKAYPHLEEQLDMLYWDKINGTDNWGNKITEIKTKYPKS